MRHGLPALLFSVGLVIGLLTASAPAAAGHPARSSVARPAQPGPAQSRPAQPLLVHGTVRAESAAASVSCVRAACDGKDPFHGTGCASTGQLVEEESIDYGAVQLFRSSACQAAWAVVVLREDPTGWFYGEHAVKLFFEAPFGGMEDSHEAELDRTAVGVAQYTAMANWDDSVKACYWDNGVNPGEPWDPDPDGVGSSTCTRWY